jgi:calcium/calmodulin-dependent protein kinase (CaM kinase) II
MEDEELLLNLTQRLLEAIVRGNYETYNELCKDDMSCIEPESNRQVIVGKDFHQFYFDLYGPTQTPVNVSMVRPHVRFLANGSVAVVSYIRLNQVVAEDGKPVTTQTSETRVWERLPDATWQNCHFHKS